MPTIQVTVSDSQAEFIAQLVRIGRYADASAVIGEGVRQMQVLESMDEILLLGLREAAVAGDADLDAGALRRFDTVKSLDRHLAAFSLEALGE